MQLGLIYGIASNTNSLLSYDLIGHTDSNYIGDSKDCKSIIGLCFFINEVIVS